jgi:hypothetical protein
MQNHKECTWKTCLLHYNTHQQFYYLFFNMTVKHGFLTLRELHRVQVLSNKVPGSIFGQKREKVRKNEVTM